MSFEFDKTVITATNEEGIKDANMTPKDFLFFLENGALFRDLKNVICKVFPCKNLEKVLTERMIETFGGNTDSMSRNVRNWLSGKNIPQREQLFGICFALKLNLEKANQVISFASDSGIHYRNPQELIYAFCLRFDKSWTDAKRLIDEVLPECIDYKKIKQFNIKDNKYTKYIRNDFDTSVTDEETLKTFILDNQEYFASVHLTAYVDFMKMVSYLQNPDGDYSESYYDFLKKNKETFSSGEMDDMRKFEDALKTNSVAEIVEQYMKMSVPENTGRKGDSKSRDYTYLQKIIKKNWPTESIISKMKNQDIDVSRKVMLLLHLLTEEFEVSTPVTEDDDNFWLLDSLDEEETDVSERMEIRINQLNIFLDNYGMNHLDPGNPFDCLIMYSLRASYSGEDDEYMSERLESVLHELFENK